MPDNQLSIDPPAPEYPFPWMPLVVGSVVIVGHDGHSYVDDRARTYWSGAAEPTEADAIDAVTTPRARPAPVPIEVSPWQIRRALNAAGLRSAVEAAVAAADQDTRDGWEFATTIRRDNALIASMSAALGLTSEQVDDLFRSAASAV